MGRAKGLFVLTVTLLAAGLIYFALGLLHARGWPAAWPLGGAATACFFLAACGGIAVVALFYFACDRLRAEVRRLSASNPGQIAVPETGFVFLGRAMGELIESAERSIADAAMRAQELEIQLRVATAERRHAEAIIYSISDAVVVTDRFDELVLANESAAQTFDFELAEAARRPIDEVLRDARMIELIRGMRQSEGGSGRRVVEHVVRNNSPDAAPRVYRATLSSVAGADGSPAGVVAVLHDMTREKEVAEMKNDFVSMVSHELRTPLASIKAYVEMLIDGEARDAKTEREFYDVIQNEANRLGRLIDNILNISRIESGLVRVNRQPQSLAVIVKDAMEVIAPQASQKQITMTEDLTPVFYQTSADRDMLYQAVLNLLSNAVKYTPVGGSIAVRISVDETQKKVVTRISDTGVGIPPKDLPFVFDKFFRAEANNRMASGTGLGLSLVKHIIESAHKGRVFVESHVGKGSCFGFELDLCE